MTPRVVCADGAQMLMEYLEGTLAPELIEAIESHVMGCPRCVAFIESYRQTPRILRAATAASLPSDLAESLHRFLASRRGPV
jgi:anti-sigma factor RsiW